MTAHNRWWSKNTDYATANGGEYEFFLDDAKGGNMAVPLEARFWTDLLTDSVKSWGLTTYEQDWCVSPVVTRVQQTWILTRTSAPRNRKGFTMSSRA